MRLGVGLPVSGAWATPDHIRQVATRAEDLGYDSLWTFQRLLHPVDQEWGQAYHAVLDPIATLAFAAGFTSRIRLGIAVLNLPFYNPLVLSKALTTVDVVSDGRLDVGLGLGWARQEFDAVGASMERRGARAAEFVACLKTIWQEPEVQFSGEFYSIPQCRVDPKPVQHPHPPLLMGGGVDAALRRIGRIADGWISSSRTDLTTIGTSIDLIKNSATAAGKDPSALRFVVRGVVQLHDTSTSDRMVLQGTAADIRSDLATLEAAGVTEVFFDLNWDPETVSDDVDDSSGIAHALSVIETLAPSR